MPRQEFVRATKMGVTKQSTETFRDPTIGGVDASGTSADSQSAAIHDAVHHSILRKMLMRRNVEAEGWAPLSASPALERVNASSARSDVEAIAGTTGQDTMP